MAIRVRDSLTIVIPALNEEEAIGDTIRRCLRRRRPSDKLRIWKHMQGVALQTVSGAGMRYRLPSDPVWAMLVGAIAAIVFVWLSRGSFTSPLASRWLRPHVGKELQVVKITSGSLIASEFRVPSTRT